MTLSEIGLVRTSFAAVVPIADQAGQLFYRRLFELDPSVRDLFKGDMREQSRKLMQMLQTVVGSLDRLEAIVPAMEALAVRHVRYGVVDAHYQTVGDALLWTLREGLADGFTRDVEAAWISAYGLLSHTMKVAAGHVPAPEADPVGRQHLS